MQQRCHQLDLDKSVKISRTTLLNIYKERGVVRRKASFKFNRRLRSEHQAKGERVIFLGKLLNHMRAGRQIIYMDETSTHLWEKMKSFWMPKEELIDVTLNKERGKSITIIGGISNKWPDLKYIVTKKTNKECVREYFEHIKDDVEKGNCVMVLDNHKAHNNNTTINMACSTYGIDLEFLPPTASELNPVERMWAYFKRQWR